MRLTWRLFVSYWILTTWIMNSCKWLPSAKPKGCVWFSIYLALSALWIQCRNKWNSKCKTAANTEGTELFCERVPLLMITRGLCIPHTLCKDLKTPNNIEKLMTGKFLVSKFLIGLWPSSRSELVLRYAMNAKAEQSLYIRNDEKALQSHRITRIILLTVFKLIGAIEYVTMRQE